MRRHARIALLHLVCALTGSVLCAQTDSIDAALQVQTVVITGQYVPTDTRETVNAVRILNQDIIRKRAAVTLEELLNTDPNIRVNQDAVLGSSARLNGLAGENLKILVDGMPVMGRLNGNIDLGQIPLQSARQIEIIDGAQSLMYGSSASAGVINIITQRSQSQTLEGGFKTQFESNGFTTHQARLGFQKGKFTAMLNGNKLEFMPNTDSLRSQAWNPKQQHSGRAMLRFKHKDLIDLRLNASQMNEVVDNLGEIRRPQFKPYAFDDIYDTRRTDVNVQAEGWMPGRNYFWQASSGVNDFYRIRNSYRYDVENDTLALLDGQQDSSGSTGSLHRFTLASNYRNAHVNGLIGVEQFTEWATGRRFRDTSRAETGLVSNADLGIFASVKWQPIAALTVQGGARYTNNRSYGSVVTPAVWLAWLPSQKTQLRLSYANGFRSPGMKELYFEFIDVNHHITGNTNLRPERSHNLRAELRQIAVNKKSYQIDFQIAGFYNDINDRITLSEVGPVRYTYLNIANWRTMGGGITLQGQFLERIKVQTGAVHTAFYNALFETSNLNTRELNWSTDWTNDLTIDLYRNHLNLHIWHKRTGATPYFFSENQTVKEGRAPAWSLLNASVSGTLWKRRINLSTGVKNILDKRTLENRISDGIHTPVTSTTPIHWGRTYFVSAGIDLGAW